MLYYYFSGSPRWATESRLIVFTKVSTIALLPPKGGPTTISPKRITSVSKIYNNFSS